MSLHYSNIVLHQFAKEVIRYMLEISLVSYIDSAMVKMWPTGPELKILALHGILVGPSFVTMIVLHLLFKF